MLGAIFVGFIIGVCVGIFVTDFINHCVSKR
jgi:hypothetical protein